MKYTVSIPQLKPLQDAFRKAPELVTNEVMKAGNRSLIRYQATARQKAPIRNGHLRGSIQIRPMSRVGNRIEGSVGTGLNYAVHQEQGTGIYGPNHAPIRPRRARVLAFQVGGKTVFAKSVKGTKGKWYMRGSLQQNQAATMRDFDRGCENVTKALGAVR